MQVILLENLVIRCINSVTIWRATDTMQRLYYSYHVALTIMYQYHVT